MQKGILFCFILCSIHGIVIRSNGNVLFDAAAAAKQIIEINPQECKKQNGCLRKKKLRSTLGWHYIVTIAVIIIIFRTIP
jgi:hypothetical protein